MTYRSETSPIKESQEIRTNIEHDKTDITRAYEIWNGRSRETSKVKVVFRQIQDEKFPWFGHGREKERGQISG